ncbi:hypothetical protein LINGRAHAP2_LOCUS7106 [Linum grandiflorum]
MVNINWYFESRVSCDSTRQQCCHNSR